MLQQPTVVGSQQAVKKSTKRVLYDNKVGGLMLHCFGPIAIVVGGGAGE